MLDGRVDAEHDVVTGQRLLVPLRLGEQQATRAVAEPTHLFDAAFQLFIEGELEPVLALAIGRHKSQNGTKKLPSWVVPLALTLDGESTNGAHLLLQIAQIAQRLRLVAADAALDPEKAALGPEPRVELVRVHGEGGAQAQRRVLQDRGLRVRRLGAVEHLEDVAAHAGDLDAHGQLGAVAIDDGPALRLDVEPALALLFCRLSPRRSVFHLHAVGARHHDAEREPHGRAQHTHADTNPLGALRIEVPHGSPSPVTAASFPSCAAGAGNVMMRSGGAGSIPRSVRAMISTRSGVL